jgi:hypothetical protein
VVLAAGVGRLLFCSPLSESIAKLLGRSWKMISSVTFGFLSNGVALIPNRKINATTAHPDILDGVMNLGLPALLSLVTAA